MSIPITNKVFLMIFFVSGFMVVLDYYPLFSFAHLSFFCQKVFCFIFSFVLSLTS
jgi:hypothetical protein